MPLISISALMQLSRSGLLVQQEGLDVTAHNIANLNTNGFKNSRPEFQELLSNRLETPPAENGRNSGEAAGAILANATRIFSQGTLDYSEYDWDMAIEGEGFFQVQMPDGALAYTRDGTFRLDGEGRLVNANGYEFMPAVTIPPDAEETMINDNGEVMVRRTGEIEPQVVATIQLARFTNASGLDTIGDNLFIPSDASGPAIVGQSGSQGFGKVMNHALEESTVDLSREVVEMIGGQRAYSLMARALQTTDEMMGLAAQLR
jgi:flagellar basal-body rod protein FlgG